MKKLTTRYDFIVQQRDDGIHTTLTHLQNLSQVTFFTALGQGDHQKLIEHMNTLTDEQCDQWLDLWRTEQAKLLAKEEARRQREYLQFLVKKEREEKLRKKEENRRKQLEAVQRKQKTEGN